MHGAVRSITKSYARSWEPESGTLAPHLFPEQRAETAGRRPCDPGAPAAHYATHEPRSRSIAGAICAWRVTHAAAKQHPAPRTRPAPGAADGGVRAMKRRREPDAWLCRTGTDFERRVLAAMATERPSAAQRARMRHGL